MPLTNVVSKMDRYFWNEHTDLLPLIDPEIEEKFPDVWRWLELKEPEVALSLIEAGATVYQAVDLYWLGIPRERELFDYVTSLLG